MPLYEYQCSRCEIRFESRKSIEDRHSTICPKCAGIAEKIISAANYTFGWVLDPMCHERFGPKDRFIRNV